MVCCSREEGDKGPHWGKKKGKEGNGGVVVFMLWIVSYCNHKRFIHLLFILTIYMHLHYHHI